MPRAHGRLGRPGLEQPLDRSLDEPAPKGCGPLRRPSLPSRPPPEAPLPLQRQMAIDGGDAPADGAGPCVITLQHAEHQDSTLYRFGCWPPGLGMLHIR